MYPLKSLSSLVLAVFVLLGLILHTEASDLRNMDSLMARYTRAHSLGNNYHFSARDGWETVNVTNLSYKYRRSLIDDNVDNPDYSTSASAFDDVLDDGNDLLTFSKRAGKNVTFNPPARPKNKAESKANAQAKVDAARGSNKEGGSKSSNKKSSNKSASDSSKDSKDSKDPGTGLTSSVKNILASLKGTGKAEPVTITWYTGHDLENPSCWPNPTWAPTDASFACALTLTGWTTRPKCFRFLELCNTPKKCVFVRVVDSCAGCKKGSKHVDLTQAAFKELASLDEGILQVQMRQATEPDGWLKDLWGPKE